MRKPTDSVFRQWNLLRLVPPHGRAKSTSDLHQALADQGIEVDVRTIQRDLNALSTKFPLVSFTEGRTNYWHWLQGAPGLEIPAMSPATALALKMAFSYVAPVLPSSVQRALDPYLQRTGDVLADSQLADWDQRVRLIPQGLQLVPPAIDQQVLDHVFTALIEGVRFECTYQGPSHSEPQAWVVNPVGLVVRSGVFYLVCTLWDYKDIKHLALQRMHSVRLKDDPASTIEGFDFTRHIEEEGRFAYPVGSEILSLELRVDSEVAKQLAESRLSSNQTLEPESEGFCRLQAEVPDNLALRWWLLSFGQGIEVLAPETLRREMTEIVDGMARNYHPSP